MEPIEETLRVKTFSIAVETPDGKLPPTQIGVPEGPLTLAELVPPMLELTNGIVRLAVRRAAENGRELSCKANCPACCSQLVPVSIPEALFIAQRVKSMPDASRRATLQHFAGVCEALRTSGVKARVEHLDPTGNNESGARAYFDLGLPCPFMQNGSCSIHGWRPISCREYNVTSPAENCANPHVSRIDRVVIHRTMTSVLARLCSHLLSQPARLIPLALIFEWFEKNGALAKRTWEGPQIFDLMLKFALGQPEPSRRSAA